MEATRKSSQPADQANALMARKPSLLIVDDESNVRLTLQLVFEDGGYLVATAESGAQAIQMIRGQDKFDAVLTDMSMEHDQSGVEVAKAAAQLRPRPVIVVFTGFGTVENMRAAVGTAVDHFALKPIDLHDFKHVLARLLALRRDGLAASKSRQ
jgi:DNA-binding NtrC family response regulator